jgi:hypothetical protein
VTDELETTDSDETTSEVFVDLVPVLFQDPVLHVYTPLPSPQFIFATLPAAL